MNQFENNYLSHHGIKGMKWGVRRYQNPDGTLTDVGRRRLGLNAKNEKQTEEQRKIEASLDKSKIHNFAYAQAMSDAGAASKGLNAASGGARTGSSMANKKARKEREKAAESIDVSKMTDQDLQRAVNRMNLEQSYKRLKSGTIKTGHDKVADVLDQVGDAIQIGASAATVAWMIFSMTRGIPMPKGFGSKWITL